MEAFEKESGEVKVLEEVAKMSKPSVQNQSAEVEKLDDLKNQLEIKLNRCQSKVTLETVEMMQAKIKDIHELTAMYGLGVRSFKRKHLTFEDEFKEQLETNLTGVFQAVEDWEDRVCAAIYSVESNHPCVPQPLCIMIPTSHFKFLNPVQQITEVQVTFPAGNTFPYAPDNLMVSTTQEVHEY